MEPFTCCGGFPFITRIFADGGYAGPKMAKVVWRTGQWRLQIVKRSDAPGFEVLPKRWIVERTFAWISRKPPLGPRFRALCRNSQRVYLSRHDPHRAQTACCRRRLVMNPNFPDGFSDFHGRGDQVQGQQQR